MNILYIASVRIPNEKASGLAIMRQCEAFARLQHTVCLLRPYRHNDITEDPFEFYGLQKNFEIKTMRSLDLHLGFGWFIDNVSFFFARFSQMIYATIYLYNNKHEIDLVYTRDPWMVVGICALGFKQKIIVEAHKTYTSHFVDYVLRRASKVVCITTGLKEFFEKRVKRDNIQVEPSGVDVAQFQYVPKAEEVRGNYGIPLDKIVVGYIGKYTTMGEEKGVDELITAFATVARSHTLLHLCIVGLEDSEVAQVSRFCKTLGLHESEYTFIPLRQKQFAQYVQLADILVMNYPDTIHYRTYMSPTKLFAYMGGKKLIIASDLPSVREVVDESMVLFTTPNNQHSLEVQIEKALRLDQSTKDSIVANAYARVQEFTWDARSVRLLS